MMNSLFRGFGRVAILVAVAATMTSVNLFGLKPDTGMARADSSGSQHQSLLRIGLDEPLPAVRKVRIGVSKSMVVELPQDLRDVVVSNPDVLDAVVQTSNRVFLIAKTIGQANAFFFNPAGEQILTIEVSIERDTGPLQVLLNRLLHGANIVVENINETVILTGTVLRPADATRASDIASRFIVSPTPDPNLRHEKKVINMLAVQAREQVLLKVVVAEMQREIIKRLGVNWNGLSVGDQAFGLNTQNAFPLSSQTGANSTLFGITGSRADLGSCLTDVTGSVVGAVTGTGGVSCMLRNLEAFERNGLLRTLAEPTLTAISGETASFLAGGEFPIPVAQDNNSISVEFKPFGVGLSFTPMVQSESRISLKIATEVSEISTEGAIQLGAFALPGLKVRRANTTVELPSGGSLVIAGLLSDKTRQNSDGLPGLKSLPILGTLFRSRDFIKQETELVIIVTPYVVNPVARSSLARPDDNFMAASDPKANFLGHLNRIYGRVEKLPVGHQDGDWGFIIE